MSHWSSKFNESTERHDPMTKSDLERYNQFIPESELEARDASVSVPPPPLPPLPPLPTVGSGLDAQPPPPLPPGVLKQRSTNPGSPNSASPRQPQWKRGASALALEARRAPPLLARPPPSPADRSG